MTEEEQKLRIKHVIDNMQNLIDSPLLTLKQVTDHWQLLKISRNAHCTKCTSVISHGDVVWVKKSNIEKKAVSIAGVDLAVRHNMRPCKNEAEDELVSMIMHMNDDWSKGDEDRSETAMAVMRLAGIESLYNLVNSGE